MEALKDTVSVFYGKHSKIVCGLGICYLVLPGMKSPHLSAFRSHTMHISSSESFSFLTPKLASSYHKLTLPNSYMSPKAQFESHVTHQVFPNSHGSFFLII